MQWVEKTLGDLGEIIGGATPSTKNSDYYGGNISWITPKDLSSFKGRYISRGERNITEKGLASCSTRIMPPKTVLFTSRAPIGYTAIAAKCVCTNQGFKSIVPYENVDPLFIYYLLNYNKERIKSMGSGTTFKEISGKTMQMIKVQIPRNIEDQKRIASILDSIDTKIEMNEKINDNLQQQLRTIFRAKFTDNPELEGIEKKTLSELCNVVTKGTTPTTLGKSFVESGINFIKAESILDDHSIDKSKFAFIDEETNTLLKRSVIHAGDVVFTIAGTLGRFALIDDNILPANTNQAVAIIRVDAKKILPEYIYTCFIGGWHTDYYTKRVQQAVQANLSLTTIKSLPIPVLDKGEMDEYLRLILPIIKAIKGNEAQNENLAMLRDNLLPKLMSGEIDVSDIQL